MWYLFKRMTPPGSSPVRAGDLLAGKYRVERVLGLGGMGVVVAAHHEELGQSVAIKFVRDDAMGSAEVVERFLREARAAGKLKSEHVARVLEVGKLDSGAPYMVMELLHGSDLSQVLSNGGPMPVEMAAGLVLQACEAVAEAHGAGIVHRDLKPQNLFLSRDESGSHKIKVLDFGVSKAMGLTSGDGSLTRTRAMVGSPLYMAPEQMRSSRDVDARVDVWALGVVLFELLTQRWPFEAETMPELCLKVVGDPPLAMSLFRPDLPAALVDVVERCLQKEPAARYANAAELACALEPFAPRDARPLAERARLAMAAAHAGEAALGEPPEVPSTDPGQAPGVASATTPAEASERDPSASTPLGWDAGGKGAVAGRGRRRVASIVWMSAALLVGATLFAGFAPPKPAASVAIDSPPPVPTVMAVAPSEAARMEVAQSDTAPAPPSAALPGAEVAPAVAPVGLAPAPVVPAASAPPVANAPSVASAPPRAAIAAPPPERPSTPPTPRKAAPPASAAATTAPFPARPSVKPPASPLPTGTVRDDDIPALR